MLDTKEAKSFASLIWLEDLVQQKGSSQGSNGVINVKGPCCQPAYIERKTMQSSSSSSGIEYRAEEINGMPIIKIIYDDEFDVNKYLQYLGSRSASPVIKCCDDASSRESGSQEFQDEEGSPKQHTANKKYLDDDNDDLNHHSPVGVIEIQHEDYP